MKYEVENQRQFDSMYIYEYGLLITVIYVLSFIYGSEMQSATTSALFAAGEAPESLADAE